MHLPLSPTTGRIGRQRHGTGKPEAALPARPLRGCVTDVEPRGRDTASAVEQLSGGRVEGLRRVPDLNLAIGSPGADVDRNLPRLQPPHPPPPPPLRPHPPAPPPPP